MPVYVAKCPDCKWEKTFFARSLTEAEEEATEEHWPDASRQDAYYTHACQSSLGVRLLKRKVLVEE